MLRSGEVRDLITLGRKAILSVLEGKDLEVDDSLKERFKEKKGVFVTLLTYEEKKLRGCVGIPYPVYPLWRAVIEASIGSAFRDPRFEPLKREELDRVILELSLLTQPEEILSDRVLEEIQVGRDGLIVEKGRLKGLLLPQVPVREGWDVEEFLRHTCLKAGMDPNCWREKDVRIYRFTTEVWEEVRPWGEVRRVNL